MLQSIYPEKLNKKEDLRLDLRILLERGYGKDLPNGQGVSWDKNLNRCARGRKRGKVLREMT